MSHAAPVGGGCRYCGCTQERACVLRTGGGETCAWFDRERTVCTNDECLERYHMDREREAAEGFRRHLAHTTLGSGRKGRRSRKGNAA
jgi:hypothetical protein